MSDLPQHVQKAARKVEQEFSLDPDLPEGVQVRFDERPIDETEWFGRPCLDGVDDFAGGDFDAGE